MGGGGPWALCGGWKKAEEREAGSTGLGDWEEVKVRGGEEGCCVKRGRPGESPRGPCLWGAEYKVGVWGLEAQGDLGRKLAAAGVPRTGTVAWDSSRGGCRVQSGLC